MREADWNIVKWYRTKSRDFCERYQISDVPDIDELRSIYDQYVFEMDMLHEQM